MKFQFLGELDSLKQQLSIWRGDSASSTGVNNHNPSASQTGGIGGSSVMYAPGMLADLVREIRDATRVREEAIFNKVRSIIDEKNCNKVSFNIFLFIPIIRNESSVF